MKTNNQFSFPNEWKDLNEDLFDLISKEGKPCLDTDENHKKVNNSKENSNYNLYVKNNNNSDSFKNKNNKNRSRAYTEVNPTSKFYF